MPSEDRQSNHRDQSGDLSRYQTRGSEAILRSSYASTTDRPTFLGFTLDVAKVPAALRHLLPLAERFRVSDDLLAKTTTDDLEAMREAVRPHEDAFDAWLAGPEAYGPGFSDE
jgi:hypothetical protein